jgi:hypothetical protein
MIAHALLLAFVTSASPGSSQAAKAAGDSIPKPRDVTYCELSRDPVAYNYELIRWSAFITHGFEHFHIADPDCLTQGFSVRVMYGGKA